MAESVFGTLHLFCGSGGAAVGLQQATAEWRSIRGRFHTLAGIDVDPEACADFRALTGAPAVPLDLFSREDYATFHGHAPPPGWREATPEDIRAATDGIAPDLIFSSPPCKGFSALLPAQRAQAGKYQALNRLVLRGLFLTLEAFAADLPALILLENVPRITSRGAGLLADVRKLLAAYGYLFQEGYHDCGELGGLAQRRRRYLLLARQPQKLSTFVYRPPTYRVRAIGEVLGPLPLPDDPQGGAMHRLPRLQWRTWVRLALIPAGRDWRALEELVDADWHANAYRIVPWEVPAGTVTSGGAPSCGAVSVADPRLKHAPLKGVFQVAPWDQACGAVVGSASVRGSNGVAAVADPRLPASEHRHRNKFRVVAWDQAAGAVTGSDRVGSGAPAVADPRLNPGSPKFNHAYRVHGWNEPSGAVAGGTGPGSGGQCVADPRLPTKHGAHFGGSPGLYGVMDWDEPAQTVTGAPSVSSSNAPAAVADPRLGCRPRSGAYRIIRWDETAPAVTGAGDVHAQGAACVADPRIPGDDERPDPPPVIIALDGTWHRALTTWELAALQGFPLIMRDGRPLTLAGQSHARWRERIGNAVPPPAAQAIGEVCLQALLPGSVGAWALGATPVWVQPPAEQEAASDG